MGQAMQAFCCKDVIVCSIIYFYVLINTLISTMYHSLGVSYEHSVLYLLSCMARRENILSYPDIQCHVKCLPEQRKQGKQTNELKNYEIVTKTHFWWEVCAD